MTILDAHQDRDLMSKLVDLTSKLVGNLRALTKTKASLVRILTTEASSGQLLV